MEENNLQQCIDKLSSLLKHRAFWADKQCQGMYRRLRNLKNYKHRVRVVEEITETTSILVRLNPNEPTIVTNSADLISNLPQLTGHKRRVVRDGRDR